MNEESLLLETYDEERLRFWLVSAVETYVESSSEKYTGFLPLIIPEKEHLAPSVASHFFTFSPALKQRFRDAIAKAAKELSSYDPSFSRMFAAYCEISGYIIVPSIVDAVRHHVLHGRLRNPRTSFEIEACNIAIQAVDMLSPAVDAARDLLRDLYQNPQVRVHNSTLLLTAMCSAEPNNWARFLTDFTNSPDFALILANDGQISSVLETVTMAAGPSRVAKSLYSMVETISFNVADALFHYLFSTDERSLVLFNQSFLEAIFPSFPFEESARDASNSSAASSNSADSLRYEVSTYTFYLTSMENFDPVMSEPIDPSLLFRVVLSEQPVRSDSDFGDLLQRNTIKVTAEQILMPQAA